MPGSLFEEHEVMGNKCAECHTPFENRFAACSECHNDLLDISLHKDKILTCIVCHTGHSGKLEKVTTETCITEPCHKKMIKLSDHSGDPKLCFKCHPEHQPDKGITLKQTSDLIFSHKIHLNKQILKTYYTCASCHEMISQEIRFAAPKALGLCDNKRCHEHTVEEHDVKKDITDPKCAFCHYPQKREMIKHGKKYRLQHARFSHEDHLNIDCLLCHYEMGAFNRLEDVVIFKDKKKYSYCTPCHPNPWVSKISKG